MATLKQRLAELEKLAQLADCICNRGALVIVRDGDAYPGPAMCGQHQREIARLVIDERQRA